MNLHHAKLWYRIFHTASVVYRPSKMKVVAIMAEQGEPIEFPVTVPEPVREPAKVPEPVKEPAKR